MTVVHGPLYQPVAARYRQQGAALKTLRDANCRDEHTRCCHWNRDLHNRTLPFAFSRPEAGWSQPPTSALRRGERRYAHPRFTTGCRVGQPIHILWYETQQVNTIHAPRKKPWSGRRANPSALLLFGTLPEDDRSTRGRSRRIRSELRREVPEKWGLTD